jgi:TPR repeat protein
LTIRDSYDNKHAESLQWDRFAIAQGDSEAMCNYGHSDQEHPDRAFALFRRAALAGSHLGMYNMGACYFHGSCSLLLLIHSSAIYLSN